MVKLVRCAAGRMLLCFSWNHVTFGRIPLQPLGPLSVTRPKWPQQQRILMLWFKD